MNMLLSAIIINLLIQQVVNMNSVTVLISASAFQVDQNAFAA